MIPNLVKQQQGYDAAVHRSIADADEHGISSVLCFGRIVSMRLEQTATSLALCRSGTEDGARSRSSCERSYLR